MSRKKRSAGKDLFAVVAFGTLAWLGWRLLCPKDEDEQPDSAADLLRRLVIADDENARASLLRRYQQAEHLPASGRWNLQTSAAAETRLSAFVPSARELLARGLSSDPFFKVSDLIAKPPN